MNSPIPYLNSFCHNPQLPKPVTLLQEAHLANSGRRVWGYLREGETLRFKRESGNQRDKNAIEVQRPLGKLGYLPRAANTTLAQMLDLRLTLKAEITRLKESADPRQMARFRVWI